MFGSFGFMELLLILFIVLIVFGAGKLPQLGEGLGKAIKGFKKSVHEAEAIEAEQQAPSPETVQQGDATVSSGTNQAPQEASVSRPLSQGQESHDQRT